MENVTVTFKTIENNENILKAEVVKNGKTHHLFVLAIPENLIEDYKDDEIKKVLTN